MTRYLLLWLGQWNFILRSTHASALSRSMALTPGAFSFDSFMPGITGLPSTTVAPRQMVHMPEPSRYAFVWLPSFRPETGQVSESRRACGNQRQNSSRQAVSDFTFMDIYQDLSVSEPDMLSIQPVSGRTLALWLDYGDAG